MAAGISASMQAGITHEGIIDRDLDAPDVIRMQPLRPVQVLGLNITGTFAMFSPLTLKL